MVSANTRLTLPVVTQLCKKCGAYPLSLTVDTITGTKAKVTFLSNGGIEYGDIHAKEWCTFILVDCYGDLMTLFRFLGIIKPENWP